MEKNWISIHGKVDVEDGKLTYVPSAVNENDAPNQFPFALVKSNINFENGIIKFEVILTNRETKCQLVLNHGQASEVYTGLNIGPVPYGITVFRNGRWDSGAALAGGGSELPIGKPIKIQIRVIGSKVDLYISDVNVCTYSENIQERQVAIFFGGAHTAIVQNIEINARKPECFVVMQFTNEYNELYEEVIKPTCENFGFRVLRADENYTSGLIIEDIARSIRESSLVIADITPDNPNVFYEVGYAHGISKPTILLSDKKRPKLPFDLSGFRTLFYENSIGGKRLVEERLRKHLESLSS